VAERREQPYTPTACMVVTVPAPMQAWAVPTLLSMVLRDSGITLP